MKALLIAALAFGFASASFAGELDNESSVTNSQLQGTLVIRVDKRDQKAASLKTETVVTNASQAQALAAKGNFKALPADKVRTELDHDGGASSWYYFPSYYGYGNYYYNYAYWYGSWYQPCYTWNYNYYTYYYYSSYWR